MQRAETDEIGEFLQKEYGHLCANIPITHFYVKLGQKIEGIDKQKAIETLNELLGPGKWVKAEPHWDDLLFFEFQKASSNEREREKKIESEIRWPLKKRLEHLSPSPVHIIFSRACLYKELSTEPLQATDYISTDEIGDIMENVYGDLGDGNAPIEYFYLFVQAESSGVHLNDKDLPKDMAINVLKDLPGEWRSVEPQDTWPGTFFGFYPKGMRVLTEREREKKLNEEVRKPLMDKLEAQLTILTGRGGVKPMVHVVLTRACKYTPTRMDTSS